MVSPQSAPIESLDPLREEKQRLEVSLGGTEVPRPPRWGGYRLRAIRVELWTHGEERLHDRLRFEREAPGSEWVLQRLAP